MLKPNALLAGVLASILLVSAASAAVDPKGKIDDAVISENSFSLVFTAPVDIERSHVKVFGPHGPVFEGKPSHGINSAELLIPVTEDLPPGGYIVYFSVYARNGRIVTGASAVSVPYPLKTNEADPLYQTSLGSQP